LTLWAVASDALALELLHHVTGAKPRARGHVGIGLAARPRCRGVGLKKCLVCDRLWLRSWWLNRAVHRRTRRRSCWTRRARVRRRLGAPCAVPRRTFRTRTLIAGHDRAGGACRGVVGGIRLVFWLCGGCIRGCLCLRGRVRLCRRVGLRGGLGLLTMKLRDTCPLFRRCRLAPALAIVSFVDSDHGRRCEQTREHLRHGHVRRLRREAPSPRRGEDAGSCNRQIAAGPRERRTAIHARASYARLQCHGTRHREGDDREPSRRHDQSYDRATNADRAI
jgi:hypothetical protein